MKSKIRNNKDLNGPLAWVCSSGGHAYLILEYIGRQQSWLNALGWFSHYVEIMDFIVVEDKPKIRPPMVLDFNDKDHVQMFKNAIRNATSYDIDSSKLNNIRKRMFTLSHNPPPFRLIGGNTNKLDDSHNCTSLILAVLKATGVQVKESILNWIVVHPNANSSSSVTEWLGNFFTFGAIENKSLTTTVTKVSGLS